VRSEVSWAHYRLLLRVMLWRLTCGAGKKLLDMYARMYDDLRRGEDDNPTVEILFCGSKDKSV